MNNTAVNTIYDRHMNALQRVAEKDVIHSSAIGLSLHLALGELADNLAAPKPSVTAEIPQSGNDWYAHVQRLTEYLDAVDTLVLPEHAVERAIELMNRDAAKVYTTDRLAMWLERNEPANYHDPDTSIADGIINVIAQRNERITALRVELANARNEANVADKRCAEAEAENDQLRKQVVTLSEELGTAKLRITQLEAELAAAQLQQPGQYVSVPATATGKIIAIPHGNGATHPAPVEVLASLADDRPDLTFTYENTPDPAEVLVFAADDPDSWETRLRMWFANDADTLDWLNGIFAGRHQFRNLPKAVRWTIVAAVVRSLYDPENGAPTAAEFNAGKPAWMPSAQYCATSYGNGKWVSVLDMAGRP